MSEPIAVGITDPQHKLETRQQALALKVGKAKSLSELADDYAFYCPAVVLMHSGGQDPFSAFTRKDGTAPTTFTLKFRRPVFSGLDVGDNKDWNHVLHAMGMEDWDAFLAYCGTLALFNREAGALLRVRPQSITITDPLFLETVAVLSPTIPDLKIVCFGLDTNHGCTYFAQPTLPMALVDVISCDVIYPDTAAMARAILNEEADPYKHAEQALEAQNASNSADIAR